MRSILDPKFKYVPSSQSTADRLRERFAEIRAELEAKQKEEEAKKHSIFSIGRKRWNRN